MEKEEKLKLATETLKESLDKMSEKHEIDKGRVRINISKIDGVMNYEIMNGKDVIKVSSIKEILGLSALNPVDMMKSSAIRGYLSDSLCYLSNNERISIDHVELRICFKKESDLPTSYMFIGGKAIREVTVEELITVN